ncbi:hypothetical protein BDV27DRAFT_139132 [Aspergillus caelatus]|uniref:Uncharacterized protein n=1 Tax=Aspergillus caelatus TaxID=61420 RepID=A0A5N6ZN19_9EURO|nr:uncharacterized protein BDV27DRAFT_139132 [Aspergillus caelatus]KAE8357560.1 hypothetical protein BDV27DRAFT_139132 [Aspergillus caelatus]
MVDTIKLKKVIHEGGKRGVEIDGATCMGGMLFFCTTVDEPGGDLNLIIKSVEAMNTEPDPDQEERTGGSRHIGKMVFSCDDETLCAVAYIPESLKEKLDAEIWLKAILAPYNGKLVKASPAFSTGTIAINSEDGKSSHEIRSEACRQAVQYLKERDLFPEACSDSDSEPMGDTDMLDNL